MEAYRMVAAGIQDPSNSNDSDELIWTHELNMSFWRTDFKFKWFKVS
jgi:hypothetical protein